MTAAEIKIGHIFAEQFGNQVILIKIDSIADDNISVETSKSYDNGKTWVKPVGQRSKYSIIRGIETRVTKHVNPK